MTPEERRHRDAAEEFARVIDATDDWAAPTPVREWTTSDVVIHLLTWFPGFLDGLGGPRLASSPGDSLAEKWRDRSSAVQELLATPIFRSTRVLASPFAGRSLPSVVDEAYTADIFMHTWDLATGAGIAPRLDPEMARTLHARLLTHDDLLRRSGHYGPAVHTVSEDPVMQLMAFVGRDPTWTPASRGTHRPTSPDSSAREATSTAKEPM